MAELNAMLPVDEDAEYFQPKNLFGACYDLKASFDCNKRQYSMFFSGLRVRKDKMQSVQSSLCDCV
ncbi:hypothetical protein RO3G_17413 [Rhizopus delemar RA 99-880]|uniref:Uncharacterized protein n=1 Tax=Rhizopus delemar (strain RA 99-880 / ATCC MYA-4621 / FGSC 9543 / NRRL 43880) TaxID=246409 RepID=I1CW71_RHIO9|nr:hypothetical protein RO3G_17413 [Rhizopus delemar RA 99-880]|eukprot:EIE92701.1 hypothetical protein RO3G_17413 [Rhizopus delemar RA 99-880]